MIQKLLDWGHSLDCVIEVLEEFLMHLQKQDSFGMAGAQLWANPSSSPFELICHL